MASNILNSKEVLEQLNALLTPHIKLLSDAAINAEKLNKAYRNLPSDLIKANQEQAKSLKEITKSQKQLEAQEAKMARARIAELKLQQKREQAFDKYEKQLQREQRLLNRTTGMYNQVQQRVNKLTLEYNNLATKKALNGKLNQQELSSLAFLEKQLNKYQTVLKSVDANIQKHQRNVGNYKSGYDGLGMSIAQLSREMPAFANSVQTGFMAISNNLPIFFDEIARTKKEVAALRAEGKQTQGVMSRLASAFFSFQTLLSVGVVLLTVYGKDLVEWASNALGASNATSKLAENTKKVNEEAAELSSRTIPQFQALVKISQDATKSEKERSDAIKELNNQYPDFNANILQEGNNTDTVNTAIDNYITKLGQKAKAQASMNLMQEKYNELIILEQEQEQLRQNILDKANENRKLNNKELFKTQEEAIEFYEQTSAAINKNAAMGRRSEQATNNFEAALDSLNGKNDLVAQKQEEINGLMQVYIDNVDLATNKVNSSTSGLAGYNEQSVLQIETTKFLRIELEKQVKQFEDIIKLYPKGSAQAEYYTKRVNDLKIVLGEMSALDVSGAMKEIEEQAERHKKNNPIAPPKDTKSKWEGTFQSVTDVARRAFGIINQLTEASFQRQYDALEAQKNNAIQFAGESATARAEIEAQYEKKRQAIQQKEARSKKLMSIFDITVDTASAVVRALATGGIPLAIAVGALGAAQLALVASQPIPQFWQGGEVGGSQQIMVNDDPYGKKGSNYKEVIEKPNGQILTPQGRNVKMTVPKGSYVHPTYDAFINSLDSELLSNNIMPVGASNIMPMIINQGLTKGEVMEVMQNQTSRVVETINKQHGINISIDENGINKYIKKKGGTSKVMNARYSGRGVSV